jgi:hypothetical protein
MQTRLLNINLIAIKNLLKHLTLSMIGGLTNSDRCNQNNPLNTMTQFNNISVNRINAIAVRGNNLSIVCYNNKPNKITLIPGGTYQKDK